MANAFVWQIHEVRKDTMYAWAIFFFGLIVHFRFWLAGQANSGHMDEMKPVEAVHCMMVYKEL